VRRAAAAAADGGGGGGGPVPLFARLAHGMRRGGCPRVVGALLGLLVPMSFGWCRV
jgi:hypothetical protein